MANIRVPVIHKVLFFPLTIKSMTSMKAMQALQPQINALRSKYKSDPQRLQRETMELYRAHKVNPLGGCLPMVVQIPIFYALYVALSVSVDIQNAPFICFGRLSSGEDDALHARGVHLHVPQSARWAGAVLDALQRAPDCPAEVHGAHRQEAGEAAGASGQEGLIASGRVRLG